MLSRAAKEYTCITCPRGCDIDVVLEGRDIVSIEGEGCAKGRSFVEQELTDPRRNFATSVLVRGGDCPLASVRLSGPIPKARMAEVLEAAKRIVLDAPVALGQVVAADMLGLGVDIVVTRDVRKGSME